MCHNAHKSITIVYRVRQKAHLAQCPLAESANTTYLQKMGRNKRNEVSLLLTFLPRMVPCNNLGTCWARYCIWRIGLKSHLFSVIFSMFLSFATLCGNQCHNLLSAQYGRILPSFYLNLLPSNFDKIGLFLLEKLANLMDFNSVVQLSLRLNTWLSSYHSSMFTVDT